jgi:2'-5' RNA ligase
MRNLIKYNLFESFQYENGCIMLELPISNWDDILSVIEEDDIYDVKGGKIPFGLQKRPHLTLLYPIKNNVTFDEVKNQLDEVVKDEPINIVTKNIEVFDGSNYDILVIKVEDNPYLKKIHNYLSSHLPNYNKHSFNPHITIGYIKKGTGDKYCKNLKSEINGIDTITYSHKGEDSLYKLNENKMWYKTIP